MTEKTLRQPRFAVSRAMSERAGGEVHTRLRWWDALVIAAVAAWSPVVVAGTLGWQEAPHHKAIAFAMPCALLVLLALRRAPVPQELKAATAWSSVLAAVLILAPMVGSRPWTFALALPGAALAAAVCARWPAGGVFAAFAVSGSYNSLLALTPIPVYQLHDLLLAGLAFTVLITYLSGRRESRLKPTAGTVGIAIYLLVTALEVPLADSWAVGYDSFHVLAWYMLFFLVVAYAPWGRETYVRIAKGIVVVAALVGAYAIVRWIVGPAGPERDLVLSDHPGYNFVDGELVLFGSFPTGRHLGVWTAVSMPFCLAMAITLRGRWRAIAGLAVGLCAAALIGSQMRAGVVGVTLGLLLVIVLYHFARGFKGLHLGATAVVITGVLVFGTVVASRADGPSGTRYAKILDPGSDPSYQERKAKWAEAVGEIRDHPWGQGLGTVGSSDVRLGRFLTLGTTDIDSSYLEIGINQGILILLVLVASMAAHLVALARRAVATTHRTDAGLAIGACGSFAVFLVVIWTGVYIEGLPALAAWIILGVGSAALLRVERADAPPAVTAVGGSLVARPGRDEKTAAEAPAVPPVAPSRSAPARTRRLLSVIHGPVYGGGHNNLMQLREPLQRRGWETIALGPTEEGNAVRRMSEAGVEVLTLPLHRLRATANPRVHAAVLGRLRPEVDAIRRIIRERDIELVQVHGPTNPHAAIAAAREGVAVVWHIYDTRAPMALRRATMPFVVRLSDAVTVIGEHLVKEHPGLARLGERVVIVMPPVDADAFTPSPERRAAARAELGVPEGAFVVGTVGNRNPSKGHEHLVRALARLRADHPEAVVRVLGAPSPVHAAYEERVLAEARQLGIDDAVTLRFVDPGSRVPDLIAAFDIFAITSVPRSEGMPTVILEAMASGLPVVATDVGAVSEVVEEGVTGLVVAPEDPGAIASALGRLVADPDLRRRLGKNGLLRVTERYDKEALADQHARAYALALAHRAARGR